MSRTQGRAACRHHGPRRRDAPRRGRADLLAGARRGRLGRADDHGVRPRGGSPAGWPARSPTSTPPSCSTARRSGATTARTQLALVATAEALADAGLPPRLEGELAGADRHHDGDRASAGRARSSTRSGRGRLAGPDRLSPFFIPMAIANMPAGVGGHHVRRDGPELLDDERLRLLGPRHRRGHRDDPARRRRGHACRRLRGVRCSRPRSAAFAAMRALSTRNDDPEGASRPFDAGRDGFVVAEGAATLVLEELGHAVARDARIYAEVLGYAATADAHHITTPAPGGTGAVRAARRALAKSGLDASAIDLVERPRHEHAGGRPDRARRRSTRSSASTPARSA